MSSRWARVSRGWLAALFATVIALCSHQLAGGVNPGGLAIMVSLAFSGPVCMLLAGTTLSLLRQSAAIALSQFAFHAVFSLLSSTGTPVVTPGAHSMPGMMDAAANLTLLNSATASPAMHSGPGMWAGHAIAAIITIATLRGGEGAFWALLAGVTLVVSRLSGASPCVSALPPRASSTAREAALLPNFALTRVLGSLRHRGPPSAPLRAL